MFLKYNSIDKTQSMHTGLALVLICLLTSMFFYQHIYIEYIALGSLILSMSIPIFFKLLAFLWLNITHYIGTFISKIILSFIFFAIVFPIGFLLKCFKYDSLQLHSFKNPTPSVFKLRNYVFKKNDFNDPF